MAERTAVADLSYEALAARFEPLCDEAVLEYLWLDTVAKPSLELSRLLVADIDWAVARSFAADASTAEFQRRVTSALPWLTAGQLRTAGDQLREIGRRVPASRRAAVLFLCAWAYWHSDCIDEVNVALGVIHALDPANAPARRLERAVILGLNPHRPGRP